MALAYPCITLNMQVFIRLARKVLINLSCAGVNHRSRCQGVTTCSLNGLLFLQWRALNVTSHFPFGNK